MKFTAIFKDNWKGSYLTKYFVTHHDKNQAWESIFSQTPENHTLIVIIPGEQLVYSHADIDFGSLVG
tara:strand:- start:1301 stop:1501 length:201 start_codon:yes stop_codon:yes gene_type:complete